MCPSPHCKDAKLQRHKFTEDFYFISPFHRPGNFPYRWQLQGIKSACELLTAGPALFTPWDRTSLPSLCLPFAEFAAVSWLPAAQTTRVRGELCSRQPLLPPLKHHCRRDTEVYHLPPGTRVISTTYSLSFCPEGCMSLSP